MRGQPSERNNTTTQACGLYALRGADFIRGDHECVSRARGLLNVEGAPPGISRAHIAYPPIGHGQVDHCVRDAAMAHSGRASPGAISFIRARPDESLRYNFADPSRA